MPCYHQCTANTVYRLLPRDLRDHVCCSPAVSALYSQSSAQQALANSLQLGHVAPSDAVVPMHPVRLTVCYPDCCTLYCRNTRGVLAGGDKCSSYRPGNCWCDKFCTAAGDCCDDCPANCPGATCPARTRAAAADVAVVDSADEDNSQHSCGEEPASQLASDLKTALLARSSGVTPAAYSDDLEARCQRCQDAIIQTNLSPDLTAATTITIPTFVVNVGLGDLKAQYSALRANRLIAGVNNAFARSGFQFSLTNYIEGFKFTSQNNLDARDCTGNPFNPNCERCKLYRQVVPTNLQGSQVLVIYMTPYPLDSKATFVVGSAFRPQDVFNPFPSSNVLDSSCIDGVYGVTYKATDPGGLDFAVRRDVSNIVHEVGIKLRSLLINQLLLHPAVAIALWMGVCTSGSNSFPCTHLTA